jgi:hypothetical protein
VKLCCLPMRARIATQCWRFVLQLLRLRLAFR